MKWRLSKGKMGVPFGEGYVMPHSMLGLIVEENRKEKSQVKDKYIQINDNIGVWGWTRYVHSSDM
jgi:hypothetical protein